MNSIIQHRKLLTSFIGLAAAGTLLAAFQTQAMSVAGSSLRASDHTVLGSAWEPGANNARYGGDPRPGGATWSIMGAGLSDVSGFDTDHVGTTRAITDLGVPGWVAADYAKMIDDVFNVWAAVANLTNLGQVADSGADAGALEADGGHIGDIRVAAWEIAPSGVLAHAYQPGTESVFGPGGTIAGDLHIDIFAVPGVRWPWRDDPTDDGADFDFDIYTVALHEMGHALGLGHSTVAGSIMEAFYGGARRSLTPDDIAGIQAIYGPRIHTPVPDDAGSMAALLGVSFGALVFVKRRTQRIADSAATR